MLSWIGRPNSNSAGEGNLWSMGVALRQRSNILGSDLVIFNFRRADFTDLTWLGVDYDVASTCCLSPCSFISFYVHNPLLYHLQVIENAF